MACVRQVEVLGPSIVGSYYGEHNPVAVRKGDYGRLAVQARALQGASLSLLSRPAVRSAAPIV